MKKRIIKSLAIALSTVMLLGLNITVYADEAATPEAPEVSCDSAVVIDADSGAVLYEKNADNKYPPSALAKLVTVNLALDKEMDEKVIMTKVGVAEINEESSNLYSQVGELFTVEQMAYAALLRSANDLTAELAYHVGGDSIENFVSMMNEKAKEVGAANTVFASPSGLEDEGSETTAYDMALLFKDALGKDKFKEIIGTASYTIPPTNMIADERSFANRNPLVASEEYKYDGIIGGMSGYTDGAGYCIAEAAEKDGHTLITVLMHGKADEEIGHIGPEAVKLLNYGFDNFDALMAAAGGSEPAEESKPEESKEAEPEVESEAEPEVESEAEPEPEPVPEPEPEPEVMEEAQSAAESAVEAAEKTFGKIKSFSDLKDWAMQDLSHMILSLILLLILLGILIIIFMEIHFAGKARRKAKEKAAKKGRK